MPISEGFPKMTTVSESIMIMAHDADAWLRSWQGSLRWKATLALGAIAAIGSLWNVVLAEREETKLHEEVGRHLRAATKMDQAEAIEAHDKKNYAMHLKASARVWSAVAIVLSALALFLKPEPTKELSPRSGQEVVAGHDLSVSSPSSIGEQATDVVAHERR